MDISTLTVSQLADEIINGYRIKRGDDLNIFLTCKLLDLQKGAGRIQKHFCGDHVDLCTIINARSGRCSEDCVYCAQSAWNQTDCEVYPFLPLRIIYETAKHNQEARINRFAVVTAGRALDGEEFEAALEAFRAMSKDLTIGLCASMGLLTYEQFVALKEAGVSRYHNNLETSERNFPNICTTHTYADKVRAIKDAQRAGLTVCSGGILGLGETWADRLDMAVSLSEMNIRSIPLNLLRPIPGSPLEGREPITGDDAERTIAFFRYINPEANIRLAAGRKLLPHSGKGAFTAGASATITGDMLTTSGTTLKADYNIMSELGLNNDPASDRIDKNYQPG